MRAKVFSGILMLFIIAALLSGCSGNETVPDNGASREAPGLSIGESTVQDTPESLEDSLTNKLLGEEEVEEGRVYLHEGTVLCTIVIKESVGEAAGKKIGQKYTDELKESYGNKKIAVLALRKGRSIYSFEQGFE